MSSLTASLCFGPQTIAKSEAMRGNLCDLGCLQRVGEAIRDYKMVEGAKINQAKLVGLQLCTWRGKLVLPDNVMGY